MEKEFLGSGRGEMDLGQIGVQIICEMNLVLDPGLMQIRHGGEGEGTSLILWV